MFAKALLVGALAALATAQSSVLTFTRVPNPITDGEPAALIYSTNDTSSPVTITLRQGPSGNLKTLAEITDSATNGQYIWTPPMSLPNGNDYALQITQGTQSNYFGPFSIQGASPSATGYPTGSGMSMGTSMTTSGMTMSSSANVTMTTTTAVAPVGTAGTIGTMSAGNSTALPRNTTMSSATLTAPSTTSMTSTTSASDSGADFQGSQTSGSSSSSPTDESSASINLGSSIALFGAIAAAVFMQ